MCVEKMMEINCDRPRGENGVQAKIEKKGEKKVCKRSSSMCGEEQRGLGWCGLRIVGQV